MILLINGAFGVGKTTVAREVAGMLPGAMGFDPEEIGAFLRRLLGPLAAGEDYQDLALWRALTVELALRVRAEFGRDLVVPMALWRRDYFDEITAGWRSGGQRVVCARLVAAEATVRERILGRDDAEGSHAWCLDRLEVGLAAANDPAFGIEIETEGRSPREVAAAIVRLATAA